MITVIDYGAGNLRSVANALASRGAAFEVTNRPEAIDHATALILPGVGHFGHLISSLEALRLRETLTRRIHAGVPFFGICLGMQALFESSEEAPGSEGLGILRGEVRSLQGSVRVPHIGWNQLQIRSGARLFAGIDEGSYVYFAHGYAAPAAVESSALCEYGGCFSAAIELENVHGTQFHPEKSGEIGMRLLTNFLEIARC